jgi:hypothetical protein
MTFVSTIAVNPRVGLCLLVAGTVVRAAPFLFFCGFFLGDGLDGRSETAGGLRRTVFFFAYYEKS